jgi:hypothetical protein
MQIFKISYLKYIALFIALFIISCEIPSDEGNISKNNILIVLDLSDRLSKQIDQEPQVNRDKEIIQYIYKMFDAKVRDAAFVGSRDEIKVVLAPQKDSPNGVADLNNLRVNMEKISIGERRNDSIPRKSFIFHLNELYKYAYRPDLADYKGADIWQYFDEDAEGDLYKGDVAKCDTVNNYVFVITDGYMAVDGKQGSDAKDWQICTKKMPTNTKIMLLELTPTANDGEYDRLKGLWTRWFQNMGVQQIEVLKRDPMSKIKERIAKMMGVDETMSAPITRNCHDSDNDKETDSSCETKWTSIKNVWDEYQNLPEGADKEQTKTDVKFYCQKYLDKPTCSAHAKDVKCIVERIK